MTERQLFVFISAVEPSADLHAASLIRAARELHPAVRFVGVGGPRMAAEGCEIIHDMTAEAAMLLGALRNVRKARRMLAVCRQALRAKRFAAAVLVDSPALHLRLAKIVRKAGVPVLYYVAPQLWAWGAWRIRKLRRRVDRLAVILPFEEAYFRQRGVDAAFVGHPLADVVAQEPADKKAVDSFRALGQPLIALLPGSRRHVVQRVLPGQLQVARSIADVFPKAAFSVSIAHDGLAADVQRAVERATRLPQVTKCPGPPGALIHAADLILVASGTAAVEVALHRRPMIVMYNASRFFYHALGRWVVRTPHLSLPNILAGRRIVPEFMPYYTSTAPIAETAIRLLSSSEAREAMLADLDGVTATLREPGASRNVAGMLLSMIAHPRQVGLRPTGNVMDRSL
jgi:lipid-A-disaccharide synthase